MKTFDEQIRELQAERHRNEWWAGLRRRTRRVERRPETLCRILEIERH